MTTSNSPSPRIVALLAACLFLITVDYASGAPLDLSGATAVASSQFDATRNGSNAFDGSHSTANTDRWVSDLLAPDLNPWVYVDLGSDLQLNTVQLDFQNQDRYVPDTYQLLMRTEAQGSDNNPANWTEVASLTGATLDATVGNDHLFDFSTNTYSDLGTIGGTGSFSGASPVGRYLMFNVIDLIEGQSPGDNEGGQNGISVLEIEVDAAEPTSSVPEPHSIVIWSFLSIVVTGFGYFRWRRK